MKCTSKKFFICILMCAVFLLEGCGSSSVMMPFSTNPSVSGYNLKEIVSEERADAFSSSLCVGESNVNSSALSLNAGAAALFDVNHNTVLYAKNMHEQVYPASLTKILTALVALDYGSLDDVLTATTSVQINESGAQLARINPGDTMTLDQALHILLLYSANDVANLIAEHYGMTLNGFYQLMNDKASSLGCFQSNFSNSNGLSDETHYVTTYDLYLIMNAAISYSAFTEIISMPSYETVYYDKNGDPKNISVNTTNLFLRSDGYSAPEGVTVIGGKTGTTNAAGHCLILLAKDTSGNPYIAIVMKSESRDTCYEDMQSLLGLIP